MANPNFAPSISTNEVWRNLDTSRCLTDDLDAIETNISDLETSKADSDHTHSGYAAESHTHAEYATASHEHAGYAAEDHTHTDYASSIHTHAQTEITGLETALSGKADASHTHSGYATEDHTHTEYASTSHSHSGYASSSHTHSGYASSSHSHSEYADADHNHDSDYFSVDGGTINGDTNVAGVLRVQGQQAFYYQSSSSSQTIGTNNATGGTTICCGSTGTVGVNGQYMKTPTILPRATGTYSCGNANFRWSGIYSTAAVNVSSDRRMKRGVYYLNRNDMDGLADFINKLNVVTYNYKDDAENDPTRLGLIAQDVRAADSEISKFFIAEDENGMLGLKPADLVFPLIATVQNLTLKIAELELRLDELTENRVIE